MNAGYNYDLVIWMIVFSVGLLVFMTFNHSRDTDRYKILMRGIHILVANQILDIVRAKILCGEWQLSQSLVYLTFVGYFLTEVAIMLLIAIYMLSVFPWIAERRDTLKKVIFLIATTAAAIVISTPITHLVYDIQDGAVAMGPAYYVFFGIRLLFLMIITSAFVRYQKSFVPRLYQNWMVMMIFLIAVHISQFFVRDYNVFGVFGNAFFLIVYELYHASHYEEGSARMNIGMYYGEIEYRLAKKKDVFLYEICVINYDSLIERKTYTEEELDHIYDLFTSKLTIGNRNVMVFQKSATCLGVVASKLDTEGAQALAAQMSGWMNELLESDLRFSIVGMACPKYVESGRKAERLFQYLQPKCVINSWYLCNQVDYEEYRSRDEIMLLLKNMSLDDEDVVLFGRPIVDCRTLQIQRFEILCRVQMAGGGFVTSDQIIRLAEQYGYVHDLNMVVFRKICAYLDEVQQVRDDVRVSLHISSQELETPKFADDVLTILSHYELPANAISFEVEMLPDGQTDVIRETMNRLRDYNIGFMLADFKVSAVDMDSIAQLPFDAVKFNRHSVEKAQKDATSFEVIGSLVDMIKEHGYSIVFKGVDNEDLEEIAFSLGADYMQGYRYAKPFPLEEILTRVDEGMMF